MSQAFVILSESRCVPVSSEYFSTFNVPVNCGADNALLDPNGQVVECLPSGQVTKPLIANATYRVVSKTTLVVPGFGQPSTTTSQQPSPSSPPQPANTNNQEQPLPAPSHTSATQPTHEQTKPIVHESPSIPPPVVIAPVVAQAPAPSLSHVPPAPMAAVPAPVPAPAMMPAVPVAPVMMHQAAPAPVMFSPVPPAQIIFPDSRWTTIDPQVLAVFNVTAFCGASNMLIDPQGMPVECLPDGQVARPLIPGVTYRVVPKPVIMAPAKTGEVNVDPSQVSIGFASPQPTTYGFPVYPPASPQAYPGQVFVSNVQMQPMAPVMVPITPTVVTSTTTTAPTKSKWKMSAKNSCLLLFLKIVAICCFVIASQPWYWMDYSFNGYTFVAYFRPNNVEVTTNNRALDYLHRSTLKDLEAVFSYSNMKNVQNVIKTCSALSAVAGIFSIIAMIGIGCSHYEKVKRLGKWAFCFVPIFTVAAVAHAASIPKAMGADDHLCGEKVSPCTSLNGQFTDADGIVESWGVSGSWTTVLVVTILVTVVFCCSQMKTTSETTTATTITEAAGTAQAPTTSTTTVVTVPVQNQA